eukprot:1391179-Amorphochlora_amoeboformis.AAC.1
MNSLMTNAPGFLLFWDAVYSYLKTLTGQRFTVYTTDIHARPEQQSHMCKLSRDALTSWNSASELTEEFSLRDQVESIPERADDRDL